MAPRSQRSAGAGPSALVADDSMFENLLQHPGALSAPEAPPIGSSQVPWELAEAPESTSGGSFWARAPTHSGRLAGHGDAGRVRHGCKAAGHGRATVEVAGRHTAGSVPDALDPQAAWRAAVQPAVGRSGTGSAVGDRLREGRQRLAD